MALVELRIPPDPSHVRTARLVGVAAARRAGLPEEQLDELRLALGEACGRAVALHVNGAADQAVSVRLRDEPGSLLVEVEDRVAPAEASASDAAALGDDELLALWDPEGGGRPDLALDVLRGLVDEVDVRGEATGTTVVLRWPLPRRETGGSGPGGTAAAGAG